MASLLSFILRAFVSSVEVCLSSLLARGRYARRRNEGFRPKVPKPRGLARTGETSQEDGHAHGGGKRSQGSLDTGFGSRDDTAFGSRDELPALVFVLDSVATSHVAGDTSLFSPPFRTDAIPAQGLAGAYQARDGTRLPVAGAGTVSLDNFHLPNVLCVPGLGAGLIRVSVHQLVARGYLVMFGGGQCSVREQSSGELVGKGQLHDGDGGYYLEFLNIPDNTDDGATAP